ncbi:MAG: filamentous hemagglutinin N-terminal domain-containing protein [Gammaproteobacteria bacterium]
MPKKSLPPSLSRLAAAVRAGALLAVPGLAFAGPTGETLVQGSAAVARPDAVTTTITQTSERAVLNWHDFSIDGGEAVQFVQPGASAAILNRVVGGQESQILGRLDANGRVFLVNPQGIYFGAGARVDTSGFAASALDIADDDFMAGRHVFSRNGAGGQVRNDGHLSADQFVVLMGERVENEGLIEARLGTVVLAAGSATTLQLDDAGLVNFAVDETAVAATAGVDNAGQIVAEGGRVLMTAKVANDLVATAVNNEGLVQAHRIDDTGGEIYLRASGGDIRQAGTLDARGVEGANGGTVIVKGDQDVVVEDGAAVLAGGDDTGRGGAVRLIADGKLTVRREATVNVEGGDGAARAGGFIEVSGHRTLAVEADLEAGAGGHVLIDPARLTILNDASAPAASYGSGSTEATVGKGYLESLLNSSIDVTLAAADEITNSGLFSINASGFGDLALRIGEVTFPTDSSGSFGGHGSLSECLSAGVCDPSGSGATFTPGSNGSILLSGVNFNIGGFFDAEAGEVSGDVVLGHVTARGISINSHLSSESSVITHDGIVHTGNLFADSGSGIGIFGDEITVNALTMTGSSESDAFAFLVGNQVNVLGDVNLTGSDVGLSVFATGNVNFGGRVRVDADDEALISVDAFGFITVNQQMEALGDDAARISLTAGKGIVVRDLMEAKADISVIALGLAGPTGGRIDAAGTALLRARSVGLGWDPLGAGSVPLLPQVDIDARTQADELFLGLFARSGSREGGSGPALGAGQLNLTVDNRANTGFTEVNMQTGAFVSGEFGPFDEGYVGFGTVYEIASDGVNFGSVKLNMGGNTAILGSFAARNLAVNSENGAIFFNHHVTVGGLPLPAEFGDQVMVNALRRTVEFFGKGPGIPSFGGAVGVGPNAVFRARNGIFFDEGMHFKDPDTPYVVFQTDGVLDLGPGITADPHIDFLAQFSTFDPSRNIVVEDSPDVGKANFFRSEHFAKLPGTTLVLGGESLFGGPHTGSLLVGLNGPIDIGSQNVAFVSRGKASISPNFKTKGFFGQLSLVGGIPLFLTGQSAIAEQLKQVFEVPIVNEFKLDGEEEETEDKENEYVVLEGEGEGEGDQLLTQQSNTGQMCE